MNRYLLKITDMIRALLPWFLRKPITQGYTESICTPIQEQNQQLADYAEESLYRVAITGQVIYLERLLNDLFDVDLRRIFITDFSIQAQVYIYTRSDVILKTFIYLTSEEKTLYAYTRSELQESYRFAVNVPQTLYDSFTADDINIMKANLDLHKTAGTTYIIITF